MVMKFPYSSEELNVTFPRKSAIVHNHSSVYKLTPPSLMTKKVRGNVNQSPYSVSATNVIDVALSAVVTSHVLRLHGG